MPSFSSIGLLILLMHAHEGQGDLDTCQNQVSASASDSGSQGKRELLSQCDCSGNGQCTLGANNETICQCYDGFGGLNCSLRCPRGFSGVDCAEVLDCVDHGWCNSNGICAIGGQCICNPGWFGQNCSLALCPRNCSGHGSCSHANTKCECDVGWKGRACTVQSCEGNCSGNGLCIQGVCECSEGYSGKSCQDYVCLGGCSGQGRCNQTTRQCECSPWFTGDDCSAPICPSACSGHGNCLNGICLCDWNWTGYDCANNRCPLDCSGHGICQQLFSGGVSVGHCLCETGYSDEACSSIECALDCSSRGICVNGTCICDYGWSGNSCQQRVEIHALEASSCPNNCSFHGECKNATCMCHDGWSDLDCSRGVRNICDEDCSGHGKCLKGECACDVGWYGKSCTDDSLQCKEGCSPSAGKVVNGTCVCFIPEVKPNVSTCSYNCSGHGSCNAGACVCDAFYSGSFCEKVWSEDSHNSSSCVADCSGHGACLNGTCFCDVGWAQASCSLKQMLDFRECPHNCSDHGTCMNGTCLCDSEFLGLDCSKPRPAHDYCIKNCSQRGSCRNFSCICDLGYTGLWCQNKALMISESKSGVPWSNSSFIESSKCSQNNHCSGHGTCNEGVCVCDAHYQSPSCSRVVIFAVMCPNDCSGRGSCINGTCSCDRMWASLDCSVRSGCPGYDNDQNTSCSGHGVCSNSTCSCDESWTGTDCSEIACPADCSNHGICLNGTCMCDPGWAGTICSKLSCPKDCSGHGSCASDAIQSPPRCFCDEGWGSSDCAVRFCPSAHKEQACTGHGACTQNGTCICYKRWAGPDCSQPIDCSSRGRRICGFCECDAGFSGYDCEIDRCEDSRVYDPNFPNDYKKSSVCSGKGYCTTDQGCVCVTGWAGSTCSDIAVCPNNCSGHGVCSGSNTNAGICSCDMYDIVGTPHDTPRYVGEDCSVEKCPGWRDGQECYGRGSCKIQNSQLKCDCFSNPIDGSKFSGEGCNIPPKFFLTSVEPAVGPLEGGTNVTLRGPGLEILVTRNSKGLYCSFAGFARTIARVGRDPDSIICTTAPWSVAGIVSIYLTNLMNESAVTNNLVSNTAKFTYFAQTQVMRISPTFAPLRPNGPRRWIGPWDSFGPNKDGSNVITVFGSYFPQGGLYSCLFGDCLSSNAQWIDEGTLTCVMPVMATAARLNVFVSSNSQQYSNTEGRASLFTSWAVSSISPVCGSQLGTALLTVFGDYLVDSEDLSRDENMQFCRFGRTSSSGQTVIPTASGTLTKIRLAFYSRASASPDIPGALVCPVPNSPLEEDDFALSLDAVCAQGDCGDDQANGYYIGQWDALDTVKNTDSYELKEDGIPEGIKYSTYYQPEIMPQADAGSIVVRPTSGPSSGGTRVTLIGKGFSFVRYGPDTPNEQQSPWSPQQLSFEDHKSRCEVLGMPGYQVSNTRYKSSPSSCKFGTDVTNDVHFVSDNEIVCVSPARLNPIDQPADVVVEIALDGQTYTDSGFLFQYLPPASVRRVKPSIGAIEGGTPIVLEGYNFFPSTDFMNGGSSREFRCVFISNDGTKVMTPANLTLCEDVVSADCTAARCFTPPMQQEQRLIVDITMSGQDESSQLTGSDVAFLMYINPSITAVIPSLGITNLPSGEDRRVDILVNINDFTFSWVKSESVTKYLQCKFGAYPPVSASFGQGKVLTCITPNVQSPQALNLEVSLNGFDWTKSSTIFTFVSIIGSIQPSSGPITGDTVVKIQLSTPGLSLSVLKGRFGNIVSEGRFLSAETKPEIYTGQVNSPQVANAGSVPFYISVNTDTGQSAFLFTGHNFFYYNVRGLITSLLPCNFSLCSELVLPKDGRRYPVTLYMETPSPLWSSELIKLQTITCGFWQGPASQGNPVQKSCGRYTNYKDSNFSAISCIAPALEPSNTNSSFNLSISINGLDYDDKVFGLIFIAQPSIHSVQPSTGLVNGGTRLIVKASRWDIPGKFGMPPLLSCIFFDPSTSNFRYVRAEEPSCTTVECTAICETPVMFSSDSTSICREVKIFISLNRRDPCISDKGISRCMECECAPASISRFDQTTNSWCAGCLSNDCASEVLGGSKSFQYYSNPVIAGISPKSVGGPNIRKANKTIQVLLSGQLGACSDDSQLLVLAKYVDGSKVSSLVLSGKKRSKNELAIQLAIPCTDKDTADGCSSRLGFASAFRQQSDIMTIHFDVSFNGGAQYTPCAVFLKVYKSDDTCPFDGCGHGTCMKYIQTDSQDKMLCMCGYWGQSPATPVCGSGENPRCQCTSDDLVAPNASCPSSCSRPDVRSSLASLQSWFCSKDSSNVGGTINTFSRYGPEGWPVGYVENALDCSAGPLVISFTPSVGLGDGGTTVRVTLNTFGFVLNNSVIKSILNYSTCYFDSNPQETFNFQFGENGSFTFDCKSPVSTKLESKFVDLNITFRNRNGIASPLNFPSITPSKFLSLDRPVISDVSMEICDASMQCIQSSSKTLSAPVCMGDCQILSGMYVAVQGADFENVSDLVCCFSKNLSCPAMIGEEFLFRNPLVHDSFITKGVFISTTKIRCPLTVGVESEGLYRVAISMNKQDFSDLSTTPSIFFYHQPLGVDSAVRDQEESQFDIKYGVTSDGMTFSQSGPVSGLTPFQINFAEICNDAGCTNSSEFDRTISKFQGRSRVRFVFCPNLYAGEACRCTQGSKSYETNVSLSGIGTRYRIKDSFNMIYQLNSMTPVVSSTGPGRYLLCFAANGVHFLPIKTIGDSDRWSNYLRTSSALPFSFNMYLSPMITGLAPPSGFIVPSGGTDYEVSISGENFFMEGIVTLYFCYSIPSDDGTSLTTRACPTGFYKFERGNFTIISPNKILFQMPSSFPPQFTSVNLTLSFNGYDFTPMRRGMTEFSFFQAPVLSKIFPAWGLYGYHLTITMFGQKFENLPLQSFCIFSRCKDDDTCSEGTDPRILSPATYISSTSISCVSPRRPPALEDSSEAAMNMFVTYTPDGRDSTRYGYGTSSLWNQVSLQGGKKFSFSGDLSKRLQVSRKNLPIGGGTLTVTLSDQFWCSLERASCSACMRFEAVDSLVIGLVPVSSEYLFTQQAVHGTIDSLTMQQGLSAQLLQPFCRVTIVATFPAFSDPVTADLKISFDAGQKFTGPPNNILIFRPMQPNRIFPQRVSRSFLPRPQINLYFPSEILKSSEVQILPVQASDGFSGASQDCDLYCNVGPRCRFRLKQMISDSMATFHYGDVSSYLTCTVPSYNFSGTVQVLTSLDGITFITSNIGSVYVYDEPFVETIYPTIGLWDASTQLILLGRGFLDATVGWHQTWCIFDFQDLLPSSDRWMVSRRWSKAFPYCGTSSCNDITMMTCSVPTIEVDSRPVVPKYPRARVGLIVDGYCSLSDSNGNCIILLNSRDRGKLASNAFFLYHDRPSVTALIPQAGFINEDLEITIIGNYFRNSFNWGPTRDAVVWPTQQRTTQKLCHDPPNTCQTVNQVPCPAFTCRFGQLCTCSSEDCMDIVSEIPAIISSTNQVVCKLPPLQNISIAGGILNISVSLNGKGQEFSNPLQFLFVDMKVSYSFPKFGSAAGGGMISVFGENFENVSCQRSDSWACLHCKFEQDGPDPISNKHVLVAATFINSSLITCVVPAATQFGIPWGNNVFGMISPSCTGCTLKISIAVNDISYTATSDKTRYSYSNHIAFQNVGFNSSSVEGNISMKIYASNLDSSSRVQCRFGTKVTEAVRTASTGIMECLVPAVNFTGTVDLSFAINGVDFCHLVPPKGIRDCVRTQRRYVDSNGVSVLPPTSWPVESMCTCILSYTIGSTALALANAQKFVFHEEMLVTAVDPPSGASTGGTNILISGVGFKDFGQGLFVYFGNPAINSRGPDYRVSVPAVMINETAISCFTPPIPVDQGKDTAGVSYFIFILDVAVPMQVSSNGLKFTALQDGSQCPQFQTTESLDNKKANCSDPFVMFTWFNLPVVYSLQPLQENIYTKLGPLYASLKTLPAIPQGPTTGGTLITLRGDFFISMARAEIINGASSQVECNFVGDVPPGQSCTTTCDFPFAMKGTDSTNYTYNNGCVDLKWQATQNDQANYWCAVKGQPPAIYSGKHGICRNDITIFRDYNQGGKLITQLECRFGDIHVPATIVTTSEKRSNPVYNRQITCVSPPFPFGVIVPVSVTLNRREYSLISSTTYFQYLKPAPKPIGVDLDSMVTYFVVHFDTQTNMGGQNMLNRLPCADMKIFQNANGYVSTSNNTINPNNLVSAQCAWTDRSSLTVFLNNDNDLYNESRVLFKQLPCDGNTGTCWHWNSYLQGVGTDVLVSEISSLDCSYLVPANGPMQCNPSIISSYDKRWCGRCVPNGPTMIELSLPMDRSITSLRVILALRPVLPRPIVIGPNSVDTCQKRCLPKQGYLGNLYGAKCNDDSDCVNGDSIGVCKVALVQLDATQSLFDMGKPFVEIIWALAAEFSGNVVEPDIRSSLYLKKNPSRSESESLLRPTFFPRAEDLVAGTSYCFHLTLTNWLGGTAKTAKCFQVNQHGQFPTPQIVLLQGGSMSTSRISKDLTLSTSVMPSACAGGSSASITLRWSVSPDVRGWETSGIVLDSPVLLVKAFAVAFNLSTSGRLSEYTFSLNASMAGNQAGWSSIDVVKSFVPSPPVVRVDGGSFRTVSAGRDCIVDASSSFDPNVPIERQKTSDLLFCWSCATSSQADCGWQLNGTSQGHQAVLTIPGSLLLPNAIYMISLSVTGRSAISEISCDILRNLTLDSSLTTVYPTIQLNVVSVAPLVSINPPYPFSISSSTTLRLDGIVMDSGSNITEDSCPFTYSWSTIPAIQMPLLGQTGRACGLVELVIFAGSFASTSIASYTIQLLVQKGSSKWISRLNLPTNSPPRFGVLVVHPRSGTAFISDFTFTCTRWVDDVEDLPLSYRFSISTLGNFQDIYVLSPWNENPELISTLPVGNIKANFSIQLIAEVMDNHGTVSGKTFDSVYSVPAVVENVSLAVDQAMNNLKALQSRKDPTLLGQLGMIAIRANYLASIATTSDQLDLVSDLRVMISRSIFQMAMGKGQRRLLGVNVCETAINAQNFGALVTTQRINTEQSQGNAKEICTSAFQAIDCYLSSGQEFADIEQDVAVAELNSFQTISNCLEILPQSTLPLSSLRKLSILSMRKRLTLEGPLLFQHKNVSSATKRYLFQRDEISNLTIVDGINVMIPGNLEVADQVTLDQFALIIPGSRYSSLLASDQRMYGPAIDLSLRLAYKPKVPQATAISAAEIANLTDLSVASLSDPIRITLPVEGKPPLELNNFTGVFNASVCAFFNESNSSRTWIPFGTEFIASCEPNCPWKTQSNKSTTSLICTTSHLTGFSTISSFVGCDMVPSQEPRTVDICCQCNGMGESCCDWRRIKSANNLNQSFPCLKNPDGSSGLDKCLVCRGQGKSFVSLALKIESGICDFRGNPCPNGLVPNACGVCDFPEKELLRAPSTGLCDCQLDPKLPTEPDGGFLLDRCGICNGQNASMDECGTNPAIPAFASNGMYQVCHSGGRGNSQVPTWNRACTGCDNVTRPDMLFVESRRPFPGGVQPDICGVCGGNGSTCPGCDGVSGSGLVRDICRVCGGNELTCIGCDGSRNPLIKVQDGCEVCGGDHFGACQVTYNYSFEQDFQFERLQNFQQDSGRSERLSDAIVWAVDQSVASSDILGVHADNVEYSGLNTKVSAQIFARTKGAAMKIMNFTTTSQKFLFLVKQYLQNSGESAMANALPKVLEPVQTNPKIDLGTSTKPCNYDTMTPSEICAQDCGGIPHRGRQFDVCGVCGGDGSTCKITKECPVINCTICCGCDSNFHPVVPDRCGKCGGDSSTCFGCDRIPFSGVVPDSCGVCGGDSSSCMGCDGIINSGKVADLCGVCGGGNEDRDVCGVCTTDTTKRGSSCAGCDGISFSGKSVDACGECGGTNLCKWRDGQPPKEAQGSTKAIVVDVVLKPVGVRSLEWSLPFSQARSMSQTRLDKLFLLAFVILGLVFSCDHDHS